MSSVGTGAVSLEAEDRARRMRRIAALYPMLRATLRGAILLSVLLGLWLWATARHWFPRHVLPAPAEVRAVLVSQRELFARVALNTWMVAMAGFALSVVFGLGMGIAMYCWNPLRRAIMPPLIALKSTPVIAMVPIVSLYFSMGTVSKLILAFTACFLPMVLGTCAGLQQIDPALFEYVASHGVGRARLFRRVLLPCAASHVALGLRLTLPLAFVGAVVAEMAGGDDAGIGYVIISASYRTDTPLLFAGVIVLALTSVGTYWVVDALLSWRGRPVAEGH